MADALPEHGSLDQNDVWIIDTPKVPDELTVVAWKRLVPVEGKERRQPDGVASVVVLETGDFLDLLRDALPRLTRSVSVELKAAERLNVTRVLAKAKRKLRDSFK